MSESTWSQYQESDLRKVQVRISQSTDSRFGFAYILWAIGPLLYGVSYFFHECRVRSLTNIFSSITSCSIIHFAVRAIVQFLFLTPKAANFPEPPKNQPYIGAIILSNLVCIFLHVVSSNPSAGEASRGYLHGGLFIDFIGQKGPISKIQLLTVDLLVLCLQILMVGALLEKEKASGLNPSQRTVGSAASPAVQEQDHDSEEQGLLRSSQNLSSQEADIGTQQGEGLETSSLGGARGVYTVSGMHPRDYFHSGEALVMSLDVSRTFQQQWHSRTSALMSPSTSLSNNRVPASTFIRRQLGIQTEAARS